MADWQGSTCMGALNEQLYVVQYRFLVRTNPADGSWAVLGSGNWKGSTCMAALNGNLYVVQGDYLVKANPADGGWEVLGTGNWRGSTCMAALNGNLYVVQDKYLVVANPADGSWVVPWPPPQDSLPPDPSTSPPEIKFIFTSAEVRVTSWNPLVTSSAVFVIDQEKPKVTVEVYGSAVAAILRRAKDGIMFRLLPGEYPLAPGTYELGLEYAFLGSPSNPTSVVVLYSRRLH